MLGTRRESGQRGLTAREEGGEQDTNENRHQGEANRRQSSLGELLGQESADLGRASTSDAMMKLCADLARQDERQPCLA